MAETKTETKSDIKLVQIKKLSVGSRFRLPGYANNETFEIIGRARPSGSALGRGTPITLTVKARHIGNPESQDSYTSRYFDVDKEVQVVRFGGKTIEAIDSRDMPSDVETIDDVAAREGVQLPQDES